MASFVLYLFSSGDTGAESFSGGRGMVTFMTDLYKNEDPVKEAMAVAGPEMLEANRRMIRQFKTIGLWAGGWRTAGVQLAPKMWREFVWPYFKERVEKRGLTAAGSRLYHLGLRRLSPNRANQWRCRPCFSQLPRNFNSKLLTIHC